MSVGPANAHDLGAILPEHNRRVALAQSSHCERDVVVVFHHASAAARAQLRFIKIDRNKL